MTLRDVILAFEDLASQTGPESTQKKIDRVIKLFKMCQSPIEIKYLVRSLNPAVGLRIGLSSKSMEKVLLEHIKDPEII
jgi:ATP-dependent DNA ligase